MPSDDYITESTDTNYVLISVPHGADTFYYTGAAAAQPMTSFLRIGAVTGADPTAETGWDFAKLVVGFNDDTRTRPGDDEETSGTVSQLITSDGMQLGPDVQAGMRAFYGEDTALSADQLQRVKESMRLHYRGGWRDHSAGNRISTTQGDKVELVRGNYKMVVMGRRPEKSNATSAAQEHGDYATTPVDTVENALSTFDVSGGHVQGWDMAPGQVTEITWVKHQTASEGEGVDGAVPPDTTAAYYTWKTVEETVKGDVETTYYGDVREVYLGPTVHTQIGWEKAPNEDTGKRSSDDATDEDVPKIFRDHPGLNRQNPIITEETWAKEIHSYTGSAHRYVGRIDETIHAKKMTLTQHIDDIKETTHVKTHLEDIHADYSRTTYFGGDFRELWYGHFGELFLGTLETFKIGAIFIDVRLAGKINEINSGLTVNTTSLGLMINTVDMALLKMDTFYGTTRTDKSFCANYEEITTGGKTSLAGMMFHNALSIFIG